MLTRKPDNALHNLPVSADELTGVRLLPQAPDLEKAICGAVVLEGKSAWEKVEHLLKPEMFHDAVCQAIVEASLNLIANGMQVDMFTIMEALKAADKLDLVGGPYGITKITNVVTSSAHIETHARIIYQHYLRREIIRISVQSMSEAYSDGTDVFELQERIEADLLRLFNSLQGSSYYDTATLAMENLKQVEAMQNRTARLTGVATGYRCLDHLTNGWQPTDLIILAARPSVGKTAFALNLGYHAAAHAENPVGVGIFSLEMSAGQLTYRFAAMMSGVDLDRIMRGRMTEQEKQRYHEAIERFSSLNLRIDDTGGLSLQQLRRKARQMVLKQRCGLIIVDYLQLMGGDRDKNGTREQEISAISRGLKALAKELQVPIIALSQLSRAIETRQNKEPQLSDLRESGSIEQDADSVIFLSRADYGQKQSEADPSLRGNALVKFAKHRNGDLETLGFQTDLKVMQWKEFDEFEQLNQNTYTEKGKDYDFS